ncbi:MAG: type pilus twitching motility protein PilT [Thermoleophilia bacterium]|nr:type pilus twitching motility protein PilT [Thermoleophilia bacterium]
MIELRDLFAQMVETGASDLHLVVGAPPQLRVRGELRTIDGYGDLSNEDTREIVFGILTNEQRQKLEVQWELDFSYAVPGLSRWRVNAFFQRGAIGAAFRIIPEKIRPLSELAVPDSVYQLADLPRGLVLVTGPTGSGKSTTLAGMIDVINEQRHEHILTVEDPIEFIHQHKNCIINQREVGADTDGFARALKSALRQDPDVILVGEMRDLETIQTALTAAETGHLVFGTLHTNSAAGTIDRIIDVFPPHQQAQVRVQLASSLQGVVTQTLVPTKDGQGRIVACEVMIPNGAVRNLIREGKIFQIPSVMQTSQGEGMQTLDAALATLVRSNQISREEAVKRCHQVEEFGRLLDNGGGAPTPGKNLYQKPEVIRLQRKFDAATIAASAPPAMVPQAAVAPPMAPVPAAPEYAPPAPVAAEFTPQAQPQAPAPQAYPSEFGLQQPGQVPAAPPVMEFAPPPTFETAAAPAPVAFPAAAAPGPLQPGQVPELPAMPPQQQWPIDPATGQPVQQQWAPPPPHGEVA